MDGRPNRRNKDPFSKLLRSSGRVLIPSAVLFTEINYPLVSISFLNFTMVR